MANRQNRFSIIFKEKVDESVLGRCTKHAAGQITDACETLCTSKELSDNDVLSFPEIGVLSATLDDDEVSKLMADESILEVNEVREVRSEPIAEPHTDDEFFSRFPSLRERPLSEEAVTEWNTQMVNADQTWDQGVTGTGVKVGIIDSGIDKQHPDLSVSNGVSFYPGIDDWDDNEDGHGTICAGIAGARRNTFGVTGVAPDCLLHAIKISRFGNSNTHLMLAGMVWAARQSLDVVNLSLWAAVSESDAEPWEDMVRAAQLLNDNGCVVVGIAGNSGLQSNHWVSNPARAPGFIATGGVDRAKRRWITSSYGPPELPQHQAVELVAPGTDIRSTYRGGGYISGQSGTSFAAPHIAGAVALIKQRHPLWTPGEIRKRLETTAEDLGDPDRDEEYGSGLLDCYAAVFDPTPSDQVVNQIIGTVKSIGRSGEANVIEFADGVRVRNGDWETLSELRLVIRPQAEPTDTAILVAALGRELHLLGLFRRELTSVVYASSIASIRVS